MQRHDQVAVETRWSCWPELKDEFLKKGMSWETFEANCIVCLKEKKKNVLAVAGNDGNFRRYLYIFGYFLVNSLEQISWNRIARSEDIHIYKSGDIASIFCPIIIPPPGLWEDPFPYTTDQHGIIFLFSFCQSHREKYDSHLKFEFILAR